MFTSHSLSSRGIHLGVRIGREYKQDCVWQSPGWAVKVPQLTGKDTHNSHTPCTASGSTSAPPPRCPGQVMMLQGPECWGTEPHCRALKQRGRSEERGLLLELVPLPQSQLAKFFR